MIIDVPNQMFLYWSWMIHLQSERLNTIESIPLFWLNAKYYFLSDADRNYFAIQAWLSTYRATADHG
jgi:hypothetical protein